MDVLCSPSLTVRTVSVEIKQHWTMNTLRAQEVCERRGGRPGPSQIVRRVSVEYTI